MARAAKFSETLVNAKVDARVALLSNGYLWILNGIKPEDADTAVTTQILLAVLRLATPAAPAGVGGVATLTALTPDASANATGTATWYRMLKADGTTVVEDGTVGTAGADLNLTTTAIVAGTAVAIPGLFLLTESKG